MTLLHKIEGHFQEGLHRRGLGAEKGCFWVAGKLVTKRQDDISSIMLDRERRKQNFASLGIAGVRYLPVLVANLRPQHLYMDMYLVGG